MKLTKIKLINWHLFTNTTMEIKGNFLLTGETVPGNRPLRTPCIICFPAGTKNVLTMRQMPMQEEPWLRM